LAAGGTRLAHETDKTQSYEKSQKTVRIQPPGPRGSSGVRVHPRMKTHLHFS
jgi:hypothetical protein